MGDKALVPRSELERLIELAERSEPVELHVEEDEPTLALARMAEEGGAFDI